MKMLKKWVLALNLFVLILFTNQLKAQTANESALVEANAGNQEIEMADQMRRDGKIYVVVGCVLVVLAGMIFYLISIDKKVSRLEKQVKS